MWLPRAHGFTRSRTRDEGPDALTESAHGLVPGTHEDGGAAQKVRVAMDDRRAGWHTSLRSGGRSIVGFRTLARRAARQGRPALRPRATLRLPRGLAPVSRTRAPRPAPRWRDDEEAAELFKSGVDFLEIYDEEHSDEEDRFIAVGPIKRGVIVVAYTERDDDVLRILSARMATKKEHQRFEEFEGERHERRDS